MAGDERGARGVSVSHSITAWHKIFASLKTLAPCRTLNSFSYGNSISYKSFAYFFNQSHCVSWKVQYFVVPSHLVMSSHPQRLIQLQENLFIYSNILKVRHSSSCFHNSYLCSLKDWHILGGSHLARSILFLRPMHPQFKTLATRHTLGSLKRPL